LSAEEIFAQLDFLVSRRYSDLRVPAGKFKIQFARMGEPALNREVIEILDRLPDRYRAPGLIPCISSIAPAGTDRFFEELLIIKDRLYRGGRFQMQFSIHSTDPETRDRLMPVPKWPLARIADYGRRFYRPGDRKVCLNFAMIRGIPLGPDVLAEIFDPVHFLIKLTPLNPTHEAARHGLETSISPTAEKMECDIIKALKDRGFDVLLSIGEHEENLIGSNCGQYIMRHYREAAVIRQSYTYVPQSPGSSYPAA
jgi:23S rRNA (adenine2503-C2)-methyltransferase